MICYKQLGIGRHLAEKKVEEILAQVSTEIESFLNPNILQELRAELLLQESSIRQSLENEERGELDFEEESLDEDKMDQLDDHLHLMDQHDTWIRNARSLEWQSQGHEVFQDLVKNRKAHVSVSELQEFWALVKINAPRIIFELNFGIDTYSSLNTSQNLQKYTVTILPIKNANF